MKQKYTTHPLLSYVKIKESEKEDEPKTKDNGDK